MDLEISTPSLFENIEIQGNLGGQDGHAVSLYIKTTMSTRAEWASCGVYKIRYE